MRAVTIWMRGRGLMVIPRTSLISPTPPHASSGPKIQSHNLHYLFLSNLALTVQPQLDLYFIYFNYIPTTQSWNKAKIYHFNFVHLLWVFFIRLAISALSSGSLGRTGVFSASISSNIAMPRSLLSSPSIFSSPDLLQPTSQCVAKE